MKPAARYRNWFIASLAGTVVVAICCFTPVLVVLLAAIGLATFTPYLDFVLFPALAVLIAMTAISFRKWRKACRYPEGSQSKPGQR